MVQPEVREAAVDLQQRASRNGAATDGAGPRRVLTVPDGIALTFGIILGIGIFTFPPMVAANAGSLAAFWGLWMAGAVISLVGALCYAELSAAYPSTGGDYTFLRRAFGPGTSFMFAWARATIMQTGSVALTAWVVGENANRLLPLGAWGVGVYAAVAITALTIVHLAGIRSSTGTQKVLGGLLVLAMLAVVAVGLFASPASTAPQAATAGQANVALALVFVLLTFGGWSEAAYLSGEVRDPKRDMPRILVFSIVGIAILYLLANLAFVNGLGFAGLAGSKTPAPDLIAGVAGGAAGNVVAGLVLVAALTTSAASMFTGARTTQAACAEYARTRALGVWRDEANVPVAAYLLQSAVALALVGFAAANRAGLGAMVDYITPTFWFFLLLVGLSLFILRQHDSETPRPFRVPLYPLTPVLLVAASVYMLQSSIGYALGQDLAFGLVGIAVLALGVPVYMWVRNGRKNLPNDVQR